MSIENIFEILYNILPQQCDNGRVLPCERNSGGILSTELIYIILDYIIPSEHEFMCVEAYKYTEIYNPNFIFAYKNIIYEFTEGKMMARTIQQHEKYLLTCYFKNVCVYDNKIYIIGG